MPGFAKMKQLSFASLAYENKKKLAKREKFSNEMEAAVPWDRLLKVCEPYHPKSGKGRKPMPLETMLHIYLLQQWYGLSNLAAEESLYDIESMRRFAGLELGDDAIPDKTTLLLMFSGLPHIVCCVNYGSRWANTTACTN